VSFAVIAGWLYWSAEQQRKTTDNLLSHITKIITKMQVQMDTDTKNEVLAIFQMGAYRGNATLMRSIGELYQNGQGGVTQDYTKAADWYAMAADSGDADAMFYLGLLYANGQGVAQDYAKAREWYEKAAEKGNESAKAKLEKLSQENSPKR
jgi:TPR repeat protein